jgi:hypothetical protein
MSPQTQHQQLCFTFLLLQLASKWRCAAMWCGVMGGGCRKSDTFTAEQYSSQKYRLLHCVQLPCPSATSPLVLLSLCASWTSRLAQR